MIDTMFCKQLFAHIVKHKKILLNEKTKMLNGQMYNPALDYNLYKERLACKSLCHQYNQISPNKVRERNELMTKIIKKTGNIFLIEQPFMCDYGIILNLGKILLQTIIY